MIELDNVSILTPGFRKRSPILENATATFALGERVGIFATPGSGKSTLARMFAGIEQPDAGTIRSTGRVSWPIGFAGFLHPELSVKDNLSIYAQMVGLSVSDVWAFCDWFCRIEGLLESEMSDLTPTQRAILAYACAMSNPDPAMWIADEVITIGEPRDRERCDDVLSERLGDGGLVFLSRNKRLLKAYCDRYFVLIDQKLVPCDDLDVAQEAVDMMLKSGSPAKVEVPA